MRERERAREFSRSRHLQIVDEGVSKVHLESGREKGKGWGKPVFEKRDVCQKGGVCKVHKEIEREREQEIEREREKGRESERKRQREIN